MELEEKHVQVEGLNVSYKYNLGPADRCVVLFSPGDTSGEFFKQFLSKYQTFRVIAPDYPGRGNSDPTGGENSIAEIAHYMNLFLKELGLSDITLLGVSFGTAIVNEMLKENSEGVKSVVLIAPGEYFEPFVKTLIRIVFFPPKYSEFIRKTYRYLLNRFSPHFNQLPARNLESINKQWLAIVNYSIEFDEPIDIPTLLVHLDQDSFVRKGSQERIRALYPHYKEIFVNVPHNINGGVLEKMKRELIPQIKEWLKSH